MEESCKSLRERLLYYLKYKRIRKGDFCKSLGVSAAYISSIRVSISDDKKKLIREKYPDLNMDWLIFGEGDMLITQHGRHLREVLDSCCTCDEKDREIAALKAQIQILKEMIREMNSDCGPQLRKA